MRTLTSLTVLILLLQALAFVEAAEKRIIGTITAVDANNRSITLETVDFGSGRERIPVTVDVIRKTKITVQGEWARFANIMVGQSANVTFDDKLEAATVIAIRESVVRDEQKTVADMKTLQGNWICIAEEEATAGTIDTEIVRERNRRVTISHNNFTMRRTLDGNRGTFAGKFDIDAVTGHFNFVGTHANGDASEWIGVYEIKNDTWRVRFTFKTPTEEVRPAALDEREKSKSRMYTFRRDVD